jgi:hypothetical protein
MILYVYIYILRYSELSSLIMILLSCRDQNFFFDNDIIVISISKYLFFYVWYISRPKLFLCFVLVSLYIEAMRFRTWIVKIFEFQTYNLVQQLVIDYAFICQVIPLLSLLVGLNVLVQVHLDSIDASSLLYYNILCWLEI